MPRKEHSEFSETTYAVTLAIEVARAWRVPGFPFFASTNAEGQPGGGWDAAFPQEAGGLVFIQFKVPVWMPHPRSTDADLGPYYRIRLKERTARQVAVGTPSQHQMLCALEDEPDCLVVYAAPRFHTNAELLACSVSGEVYGRSFTPYPSQLGELDPDYPHTVSYLFAGDTRRVHSDTFQESTPTGPGALAEYGFDGYEKTGRRLGPQDFTNLADAIVDRYFSVPSNESTQQLQSSLADAIRDQEGLPRLSVVARLLLSTEVLPMPPPPPLPAGWVVVGTQ